MSTTAEKTKPQLGKSPPNGKKTATAEHPGRATRETIESVVIAIILAFLFRTFEAEAFVIPTGSMAPTLQGRHRDVECPQCGYRYRSGASEEERYAIDDPNRPEVVATVCPICRYTQVLNKLEDPNEESFTGDRILVSKFAYQIGEPERWDPIVFKFPGNPKQNYIKRLVGLPNEQGRIFHGDVYVTAEGEEQERILRKPPHKLVAMLQVVDDTNYIAPKLVEVGWPSRWQTWVPAGSATPAKWEMSSDLKSFSTSGEGSVAWLRYKHLAPYEGDWVDIVAGRLPDDLQGPVGQRRQGMLITDFYTYNVNYTVPRPFYEHAKFKPLDEYEEAIRANAIGHDHSPLSEVVSASAPPRVLGAHWVGDLAVEGDVNVTSSSGELLIDLVEGGRHHTCRIDIATGIAKLEIDGGQVPFIDDAGKETVSPEAPTALQGPGEYHVRLSNCDDEVRLWINGSVVEFNVPTTYATRPDCAPRYTAEDHLDLAPAGFGTNGAAFTLSGLRILRDVYYIGDDGNPNMDYRNFTYDTNLALIFTTPSTWDETDLFASRKEHRFVTEADQFYPLGDNSPESQDARSWGHEQRAARGHGSFFAPPYVDRDLLIGKALLIYWPHAWNRPIPFTPNVQRMGVIR